MRGRVIVPRMDLSWLFPPMDGATNLHEPPTSTFKKSLASKLATLSVLKGEYKSRNRNEDNNVSLVLMMVSAWQLEEAIRGSSAEATLEPVDMKAKLNMKLTLRQWISKNSLSGLSSLLKEYP